MPTYHLQACATQRHILNGTAVVKKTLGVVLSGKPIKILVSTSSLGVTVNYVHSNFLGWSRISIYC